MGQQLEARYCCDCKHYISEEQVAHNCIMTQYMKIGGFCKLFLEESQKEREITTGRYVVFGVDNPGKIMREFENHPARCVNQRELHKTDLCSDSCFETGNRWEQK